MIAYHLMQYLNDSGFAVLGQNLWYGESPLIDQSGAEGIVIVERGGGLYNNCKNITEFIDIKARFCSPDDAHDFLYRIGEHLQNTKCIDLPDVTNGCCRTPELFNDYDYKQVRFITDSTYQSLGKDSEGKWLAVWGFEIKYNKEIK